MRDFVLFFFLATKRFACHDSTSSGKEKVIGYEDGLVVVACKGGRFCCAFFSLFNTILRKVKVKVLLSRRGERERKEEGKKKRLPKSVIVLCLVCVVTDIEARRPSSPESFQRWVTLSPSGRCNKTPTPLGTR